MKEQTLKRRNLSGIYIFDQFPGEENRQPTCVEDCRKEIRSTWLKSLDRESLISCVEHLCETLREISDQFGIVAKYEESAE